MNVLLLLLTLNISISLADIYLFKFNNGNTRTMCKICSKLIIKTPEWRTSKCQLGERYFSFTFVFRHKINKNTIKWIKWSTYRKYCIKNRYYNVRGCKEKGGGSNGRAVLEVFNFLHRRITKIIFPIWNNYSFFRAYLRLLAVLTNSESDRSMFLRCICIKFFLVFERN